MSAAKDSIWRVVRVFERTKSKIGDYMMKKIREKEECKKKVD